MAFRVWLVHLAQCLLGSSMLWNVSEPWALLLPTDDTEVWAQHAVYLFITDIWVVLTLFGYDERCFCERVCKSCVDIDFHFFEVYAQKWNR